MKPENREVPSGGVGLRELLDSAQHRGEITTIIRYGTRAAIVLPPDVYDALTEAAAPDPD